MYILEYTAVVVVYDMIRIATLSTVLYNIVSIEVIVLYCHVITVSY